MTTQIPDSCTFDGRKWEIEWWEGNLDCIPSNELLGIVTQSTGSNNWSGRIDHFLVHRNELYLFKIEVSLDPTKKTSLPFGARREIVKRHLAMEHQNANSMRILGHRLDSEFLVFDDLKIPYTGQLTLRFPYFDEWDIPWPVLDDDIDSTREAVLTFEDGRLVDIEERVLDKDER